MNGTVEDDFEANLTRDDIKKCLRLVIKRSDMSPYCELVLEFLERNNVTLVPPPDILQKLNSTKEPVRPFVPPFWVQSIWVSFFAFMLLAALIGNATVIWIILKNRTMRTVTNYFLLNLSVADLTMVIMNAMFNFIYMLHSNWPFGTFFCALNNFIANTTVGSCVITIMALSIER